MRAGRPLLEGGEDAAHGVVLGPVAAREAGAAAPLVEGAEAAVEEAVALLVAAAHGELAELVGGVEESGGLGGDLLLVRAHRGELLDDADARVLVGEELDAVGVAVRGALEHSAARERLDLLAVHLEDLDVADPRGEVVARRLAMFGRLSPGMRLSPLFRLTSTAIDSILYTVHPTAV